MSLLLDEPAQTAPVEQSADQHSNWYSSRYPDPFYLLKIILMLAGLLFGLLFLGYTSQAQIQIADENTQLPDYSAYETGLNAAYDGDYDTALREFTIAANNGLHLAQYNLGVMYFTGTGVPQDYEQAFKWTRMAAEQGHINAQYNLATLYYNSHGIRPEFFNRWPLSLIYQRSNLVEAARWYAEAAQYDHGEAQYNLATMYEKGQGVEQDSIKAYMWARLAYDNEVPDATVLYNALQQQLTAAQLDQGGREYARWVLEHRG